VLTRERNGQLVPDQAVYRVILTTGAPPPALAGHSWRGSIVLDRPWQAPVLVYARAALALAWRELGF
jgi:putative peptide zinc metalloprotease protein